MKIISLNEIKQFILDQPGEKEVSLYDGEGKGCGCVLVHYCRANNIYFTYCGFSFAELDDEIVFDLEKNEFGERTSVLDLFNMDYDEEIKIKTYGELKSKLHV